MSKSSPVPIFDHLPHDAKAYAQLYREEHPNYHKEYRKRQIQTYGEVYLREKRASNKKWLDSLTPAQMKAHKIKHKAQVKRWQSENKEYFAAYQKKRYANLSSEKKEKLKLKAKEAYHSMTPIQKEKYLERHRVAYRTRRRICKLKKAQARLEELKRKESSLDTEKKGKRL